MYTVKKVFTPIVLTMLILSGFSITRAESTKDQSSVFVLKNPQKFAGDYFSKDITNETSQFGQHHYLDSTWFSCKVLKEGTTHKVTFTITRQELTKDGSSAGTSPHVKNGISFVVDKNGIVSDITLLRPSKDNKEWVIDYYKSLFLTKLTDALGPQNPTSTGRILVGSGWGHQYQTIHFNKPYTKKIGDKMVTVRDFDYQPYANPDTNQIAPNNLTGNLRNDLKSLFESVQNNPVKAIDGVGGHGSFFWNAEGYPIGSIIKTEKITTVGFSSSGKIYATENESILIQRED